MISLRKGGRSAVAVTVISVILLIGCVLNGAVVLVILIKQQDTALREFAVLGLFCSLLCLLSYNTGLTTPDFYAKITALKFEYLGKVFVNPLLLLMVLRFYESRISPLIQGLIFSIPVTVLVLVFTCEQNRLYYSGLSLSEEGLLQIQPGPFYYVFMCYNTILSLTCLGFCLYHRAGLRKREKQNNSILLAACLIPFLSLLIYLAGLSHGFDISNIGIMLSALLISYSIFRYGLLNKEEMLQSMTTGLIFLDNDNHLIYANRAAKQMIPLLGSRNSYTIDFGQLCEPEFAAVEIGETSYQRKITDWSSGEGQHGKLLTFEDITEIRARLNLDAMTGLLNHAAFYPMLDELMDKSKQTHSPLTVSIADIDSFKNINDTYGHASGDRILITLSDILQETCGSLGDVFRYGGEEFAVIFQCDLKTAEHTMQSALEKFSSEKFEFMTHQVTFSYGSAQYDRSENSVMLFDRADRIMYSRKKAFHEREYAEAEKTRTGS